jgi:hypothetical protein
VQEVARSTRKVSGSKSNPELSERALKRGEQRRGPEASFYVLPRWRSDLLLSSWVQTCEVVLSRTELQQKKNAASCRAGRSHHKVITETKLHGLKPSETVSISSHHGRRVMVAQPIAAGS